MVGCGAANDDMDALLVREEGSGGAGGGGGGGSGEGGKSKRVVDLMESMRRSLSDEHVDK